MIDESVTLKKQLADIDEKISEYQVQIDRGEMLDELMQDVKFQSVFLVAYFEDEAERIFDILVTPSPLKRDAMENISDKLAAIRNVKGFLAEVNKNGVMAKALIEDEREYRKQVTLENAQGEA